MTMIQRSPTLVVKAEALERHGRPLYSEAAVAAGIDADRADLMAASIPYRILPQFAKPVFDAHQAGRRRRSTNGSGRQGSC